MSARELPANLVDGTLYVDAVRADGGTFEGGAEPFPFLDEEDLC
ncbi:hypothetical protein [Leifsonia sp. NPDC058248]